MTVSSTNDRMSYPGTGSTGPFSFTFKVFAESDLLLTKANVNGDETTLVLDTDYTVDIDGNDGGTVTLTDALEVDETLVIRRVLPLTQATDLRNQGEYLAETVEDQLDRGVMIAQQLQDGVERSLRLSETTDSDAVSTALPAPVAGKFLAWNDDADGIVNADSTDLLTAAGGSNWKRDTFDGDGVTVAFTLSALPGVENNTQVYVDGVYQSKDTYSLSSLTLTFDDAPAAGTGNVEVVYNQIYEIGVPADDSVSTAKLQADAVTNAKLANQTALSVKGNATNTSANPTDLTLDTDGHGIFREGATLESRLVAAKNLADAAITAAKLASALISGLTAETSPAADDLIMLGDTSAGDLRGMTLANLFKVINTLTADATPDGAADYAVTFDTSAGTVKKALLNNLVAGASSATTSAAGIVELATTSETATGSDTGRVSPVSSMVYHQGMCKGWAYFEQNGTHSAFDSYNVTSVADAGVGATLVTWATNFANANYAVVATADGGYCEVEQSSKATGSCVVIVRNAAGTAIDSGGVCVIAFGDR
jgi:hypothetical protein